MTKLALLTLALAGMPASVPAQTPASTSAASQQPLAVAAKVARWQLARLDDPSQISQATPETAEPRAWEKAVFWVGMTALADAGAPAEIGQAIQAMGRSNEWKPGDRWFFADDHVIGQTYLWAAKHGAGAAAVAPIRATLDKVLAEKPRPHLSFLKAQSNYFDTACLKRWCWCDALFMAPPVWLELARQTGDSRYRGYAMSEWWATTDFLFDEEEKLYFRDSRFFDRRDDKGRKLFWSRGNGWVFGGIARSLPLLPKGSADAVRMTALYRAMAQRIAALQKPDGYWSPSLLAPEGSPPETSGTGFFVYGLAWGINTGLIDRATYEPVVRRGWAALTRAVQPDGKLGYVQQVSDRPDQVAASDTQYYGVGALLLAASEVARLDRKR